MLHFFLQKTDTQLSSLLDPVTAWFKSGTNSIINLVWIIFGLSFVAAVIWVANAYLTHDPQASKKLMSSIWGMAIFLIGLIFATVFLK